jgi:hypothetical protein
MNMRDKMPVVTAFIDDLRSTFGKDEIDGAIKAGIRNGTFSAREGGHEVGALVPMPDEDPITLDRMMPWCDVPRGTNGMDP